MRQRAYTVLSNAYDDVRRAISFLRWKEDDLEDIAPSLFGPRAARKKTDKPVTPAPQPGPVTPAPTAPVATPVASPSTPAGPLVPRIGSVPGVQYASTAPAQRSDIATG